MITIDEHTPVEILSLSLTIDTTKGKLILDKHEGMVWRQEGQEDRYIPWPVFFALADGCDISHRDGLWTVTQNERPRPTNPHPQVRIE